MKKNFRILSLFGVTTALLVAMLSSISAFAAPSGAVTGTITVDRDWYSNATAANNDVLVKVTDADANITTTAVTATLNIMRDKAQLAGAQTVLANTPIVGTPYICDTDHADLAACNAATTNLITNNGGTGTSQLSVVVNDASTGVITITNTSTQATVNGCLLYTSPSPRD